MDVVGETDGEKLYDFIQMRLPCEKGLIIGRKIA